MIVKGQKEEITHPSLGGATALVDAALIAECEAVIDAVDQGTMAATDGPTFLAELRKTLSQEVKCAAKTDAGLTDREALIVQLPHQLSDSADIISEDRER